MTPDKDVGSCPAVLIPGNDPHITERGASCRMRGCWPTRLAPVTEHKGFRNGGREQQLLQELQWRLDA
jgi:hypothetical protein